MKNIKLFLLSLFTIFIISCDNEPIDPALNSQVNNPNDPNNPIAGVFKVTFDGQTFQTSNVQCVLQNGILEMGATRTPNNDSFAFIIDGAAVGTFPAKEHGLIYQTDDSDYGFWSLNINDPNEDLGSVVITNIDMVNKKISGTFNYKGYWSETSTVLSKNFTNGSFTNISFLTQAPTNDVFSANINAATFSNPTIIVALSMSGGVDYISINANRANDRIVLSIKETLGVGNYTITGGISDDVKANYSITNPLYNQNANFGLVTITEKTTTRIKGTFNFTTPNTPIPYIINSGNFDVELP
jgi:Family of unknown function (DUF6252)